MIISKEIHTQLLNSTSKRTHQQEFLSPNQQEFGNTNALQKTCHYKNSKNKASTKQLSLEVQIRHFALQLNIANSFFSQRRQQHYAEPWSRHPSFRLTTTDFLFILLILWLAEITFPSRNSRCFRYHLLDFDSQLYGKTRQNIYCLIYHNHSLRVLGFNSKHVLTISTKETNLIAMINRKQAIIAREKARTQKKVD